MSEQITVCIADNDEDYRRWLERELGSAGDIRIAASVSDGRQALAAVEQHRPQVLLLDPMLPGLDGVGLLRRLRDDSETKCILLSGYFGDGALQSARDAAQSARRSMRMVTAVHRIHGTASSFMCSQVDSLTAEMYAAQDACPVQS